MDLIEDLSDIIEDLYISFYIISDQRMSSLRVSGSGELDIDLVSASTRLSRTISGSSQTRLCSAHTRPPPPAHLTLTLTMVNVHLFNAQ